MIGVQKGILLHRTNSPIACYPCTAFAMGYKRESYRNALLCEGTGGQASPFQLVDRANWNGETLQQNAQPYFVAEFFGSEILQQNNVL